MIAFLDVGYIGTDFFYDARTLVTENRGKHVGIGAIHEVQVTVADPGGNRSYEDLAWSWFGNFDIFNLKRLVVFA